MKEVPFALAVFDEIQNLKNSETLAYQAALKIRADTKLGLTGTPLENHLFELKSLFDLTAPGYLGSDHSFSERYVKPIERDLHGLPAEKAEPADIPLCAAPPEKNRSGGTPGKDRRPALL